MQWNAPNGVLPQFTCARKGICHLIPALPAEIAARFGTADALRAAVVRLSELLYAA